MFYDLKLKKSFYTFYGISYEVGPGPIVLFRLRRVLDPILKSH
jgi:hypothetical protein